MFQGRGKSKQVKDKSNIMAKVKTEIEQTPPKELNKFNFLMTTLFNKEMLVIGGEVNYPSNDFSEVAEALKSFLKGEVDVDVMEPIKSEWVHPEAEAIFNALLGAYEDAKEAGFRAQFWRSMMLALGEFYIADKPRIVDFFLNQEGLNHQPKEIPAKQAKQPSEYKKELDYSAKAGRETSGECESCG